MENLILSRRSSLLAALSTQVQTLRICLVVSGLLCFGLSILLVILGLRRPLVVGLTEKQPTVLMAVDDSTSFTVPEVKAFIYELISRKFPKQPSKETLLQVCHYFTEGPQAACEKELQAKKTFIPQEVIVDEVVWSDRAEAALVRLKRYATFNGTVTSVDSSVTMKLTKRSRTAENPWGIFVESWKEEIKK